jgi:hypothetical protein
MMRQSIAATSCVAAVFFMGCLWAMGAVPASAAPPSRIHVMLLTGESGGTDHAWRAATPALKNALDDAGFLTATW